MAPAAGHAEFRATQVPAAKGLEDRFNFTAEMRDHTDTKALQYAKQGFGNGGTQKHVNPQLRQASCERIGGQKAELDFLAIDCLPMVSANH